MPLITIIMILWIVVLALSVSIAGRYFITRSIAHLFRPRGENVVWPLLLRDYESGWLRVNDSLTGVLIFVELVLIQGPARQMWTALIPVFFSGLLLLYVIFYLSRFPQRLQRLGLGELIFCAPIESKQFIGAIGRLHMAMSVLAAAPYFILIMMLCWVHGLPAKDEAAMFAVFPFFAIAAGSVIMLAGVGRQFWLLIPSGIGGGYVASIFWFSPLERLVDAMLPHLNLDSEWLMAILHVAWFLLCCVVAYVMWRSLNNHYCDIQRRRLYG